MGKNQEKQPKKKHSKSICTHRNPIKVTNLEAINLYARASEAKKSSPQHNVR